MSDSRAESLPESELRVVLAWSGIAVTPQQKVWHRGRHLGRLDLRVDGVKVAVEYDGHWHRKPRQVLLDRQRRSRMEALGWRFVVVDADMLHGDYRDLVTKVHEAVGTRNPENV